MTNILFKIARELQQKNMLPQAKKIKSIAELPDIDDDEEAKKEAEYNEKVKRIDKFLSQYHQIDCPDDEKTFKYSGCEACNPPGRKLGQEVYDCKGYKTKEDMMKDNYVEVELCEDCRYYKEYGELPGY